MVDLETAERLAYEDVVAVSTERDVLRVGGADAASYLEGQLSQGVEALAVSETSWTLLLQPQGKVDAWMRIHRHSPEVFLLDVEPGFGQAAVERLARFKLRVDVDIELLTAPMLALRGPRSADVASLAPVGLIVLDASWAGADGIDLIDVDGTVGIGPAGWITGTVSHGPPEVLDVVRIRQGQPAMGRELDESTIPAAARIVEASVEFAKGCYVGQELVARIDSRGNNTPTRLYGLRFAGETPPPVGSVLQAGGVASGTVTSVAVSPAIGAIGLAYLKRAVAVPAMLEVQSDGDPSQAAEAVELPLRDQKHRTGGAPAAERG